MQIKAALDDLGIPYAADVLAFFKLTQGRLGQYPEDIVEFPGLEDLEFYHSKLVNGPKDILFFADVCIASHFVGFRKRTDNESDVVVYIGENEPLHVVAESAHEFIRGLATEDSVALFYPDLC